MELSAALNHLLNAKFALLLYSDQYSICIANAILQ